MIVEKILLGLEFSPDVYMKVAISDLILVSIYLVELKNETCTFERLVAECFNNFPRVFSFKRYPNWPDALKFDRPLRTLREKGYIGGSPKDKFSLNRYGERRAINIIKKLKQGKIEKRRKSSRATIRSADDRIIDYIKNTPSFIRFVNNPGKFSITDQEFRNLLRCSLETPTRIIKQNLQYYFKIAEEYTEKDIINFLDLCRRKFFERGANGKKLAY